MKKACRCKRLAMYGLVSLIAFGLPDRSIVSAKEPDSKDADRTGRPFHVKIVGSGRPMILIPGLASSGAVWDTTVDHFKANCECHALTLAGFAGQPPVEGPFLETMRKGIADYIREKKLNRPIIVGHSLGGFLTYWLGVTEPDLVGSLIAVDGLPCLPALFDEKVDAVQLKKGAEQLGKRLASATPEQFLAQQKAMLGSWIGDKKNLETALKWSTDSDQSTIARAIADMWGRDLRGEVAGIKSPVLVLGVWSKDSGAFGTTRDRTTKLYQAQVAKIPNHKVVMAENAKHFIMFDAPEWMWKQMDEFLARKK